MCTFIVPFGVGSLTFSLILGGFPTTQENNGIAFILCVASFLLIGHSVTSMLLRHLSLTQCNWVVLILGNLLVRGISPICHGDLTSILEDSFFILLYGCGFVMVDVVCLVDSLILLSFILNIFISCSPMVSFLLLWA